MAMEFAFHTAIADPLLAKIDSYWSALPIPDLPYDDGSYDGADVSNALSGLSYLEMSRTFYSSDSIFYWGPLEAAAYYLGGYLRYMIEELPRRRNGMDDNQIILHQFLSMWWLCRDLYEFILTKHPDVIEIVFAYCELWQLWQKNDPSMEWMWEGYSEDPLPEPYNLERALEAWRTQESFRAAIKELKEIARSKNAQR